MKTQKMSTAEKVTRIAPLVFSAAWSGLLSYVWYSDMKKKVNKIAQISAA
jgi:hypothetical protein